jgi:uncharacterized protein (TIGR00255 family)
MIRSMTGFGRAAFHVNGVVFEVEARSVNHRHLDLRVRLPRLLSALEPAVRERAQARISRGKVDVGVSMPEGGAPLQRLEIDRDAAREYARVAVELQESEGLAGPLSVDALLGLPGVARFAERELPLEDLEAGLLDAVSSAAEALDEMRVGEGAALERDLLARLETVRGLSHSLEARADVVRDAARERLRRRAEQLKLETGILDDARLHQEIVIAADRLDITEEIVRLRSHVDQFREIVAMGGPGRPVGRRLDFLMQEFAREANTIGAKGSDSPVAHQVVELKTEIERMREQVQNVE